MINSETITEWIDSLAPVFDRGASSAQQINEELYVNYMRGISGMLHVLEDLRDEVERLEIPGLVGYKFTSDQVGKFSGCTLIVHSIVGEPRTSDRWLCEVTNPTQDDIEKHGAKIATIVLGKEIRRQIRNSNAERVAIDKFIDVTIT